MRKTLSILVLALVLINVAAMVAVRVTNPAAYKGVALKEFLWGGGAFLAVLGLLVAVTLLISAVLIVVMLLQLVGVVPRVPLNYNIRNLMVRWRTTVLTGLAFVLVIGLMTVLLAFVNGMYAMTKGSSVPGNVMVLADGATDEVFSDLGYGDIDRLPSNYSDSIKTMKIAASDKEERMVSWELFQIINMPIPNAKEGGRMRRFVQVRGIKEPEISGAVHDLSLYDGGEWFGAAGVQEIPGKDEAHIQCVIGEGLARELGQDTDRPGKTGFLPWVLELFGKAREKPPLQVGDTFELGPRRWVVVGIMKSAGKTFDSEVWAKLDLVGKMVRKETRTTAVLRIKDGLDPAEVARDLTANFKSPAIMAKTEADYFDSLNETNKMFLVAIIFVAVVMGIGGIFGVINTMFAAIAQRTRDIGVLRILGFARWQILLSFFLESLLLAVVGGAIGCALGMLADGVSATSQMSSGTGGGKSVMLKLVVDGRILGAGMGFAIIMGCVGGLLPALSAVRMKLLDSLR